MKGPQKPKTHNTIISLLRSHFSPPSLLLGREPCGDRILRSCLQPGKRKTNKHKHCGRDGVRDKHEPSLGQTGPVPGTNWDPSLGQTGLFLFNATVKSPFCPVCPWDGWGFVPGTIVPQGPSEKCLCVFCLLFFFAPNPEGSRDSTFQLRSCALLHATLAGKLTTLVAQCSATVRHLLRCSSMCDTLDS